MKGLRESILANAKDIEEIKALISALEPKSVIQLANDLDIPIDESAWGFIEEHGEEMGVYDMSKEKILEMKWLWQDFDDCYDAWERRDPRWLGGDILEGKEWPNDLSRDELIKYWECHYYFTSVPENFAD